MVVRSTVPQSIFFTSSQLKKETTSSANFSIKKKRNDEQQNLLRYIPSGTARGMGIFFAFARRREEKPYFGLIRTQVTKSVENRKDRLLKKDNENTAAIIFE